MCILAFQAAQYAQSLSLMSWNVNGLRSFLKKDVDGQMLRNLINSRKVDVLCLQETKIQTCHVAELEAHLKSAFDINRIYWSCSTARLGYSGTAVIVFNNKIINDDITAEQVSYGIGDAEGDVEGRSITLETEKFTLVNTYVPNSGSELLRLDYRTNVWDTKLAEHIRNLRNKRPLVPVFLTGDLNVAHTNFDYYNHYYKATKLQPGTTPEEQASFQAQFLDRCGLIDTFRTQHPRVEKYSWFSNRWGAGNAASEKRGMRLDYVLAAAPLGVGAVGEVNLSAAAAGISTANHGDYVAPAIHNSGLVDYDPSLSRIAIQSRAAPNLLKQAQQTKKLFEFDSYVEDEVSYLVLCDFNTKIDVILNITVSFSLY